MTPQHYLEHLESIRNQLELTHSSMDLNLTYAVAALEQLTDLLSEFMAVYFAHEHRTDYTHPGTTTGPNPL